MTDLFIRGRQSIETIHPVAPYVALTLASWLACLWVRRQFPALWQLVLAWGPPNGAIERVVGSIPSIVASAIVASLGAGGDPWVAVWGALSGALAPILHHVLKSSPLPYTGELGPERRDDAPG